MYIYCIYYAFHILTGQNVNNKNKIQCVIHNMKLFMDKDKKTHESQLPRK